MFSNKEILSKLSVIENELKKLNHAQDTLADGMLVALHDLHATRVVLARESERDAKDRLRKAACAKTTPKKKG